MSRAPAEDGHQHGKDRGVAGTEDDRHQESTLEDL